MIKSRMALAGVSLLLLASAALAAPAGGAPAGPAEDFWSLLWFGAGWFGFLILVLLVLCSVAALAFIIDAFLCLRRGVLMPPGLADDVRTALQQADLSAAEQACHGRPSFLATVLLVGLGEARHGYEASQKAMEDAAQDQNARLHRRLDALNLVSSVAPMLGLLGTVWGMVVAFQRVAETHGRADPGQLAGGIYQALYTTVIGLVIAIPGLVCYGWLRNRLDGLSAECSQLADRALAPLRRARVVRRPAEPLPAMTQPGSAAPAHKPEG
jgi:biopolymer transport protein ExbB